MQRVATSDTANPELLTHYYRNDYNTVKNCVLEVAKQMNYNVETIDDRYKVFLRRQSHIMSPWSTSLTMKQLRYDCLHLLVLTKKALKLLRIFTRGAIASSILKGKG